MFGNKKKASSGDSLHIVKNSESDRVVALAGNPNVGKSTVFNGLTGLNQHTGNWPGKTVTNAQGRHSSNGIDYVLVDLPGTYSLMAHSAEEEVARDFICFGKADSVIIVCDATCIERNLNLVLQTLEITPNAVVCLNLMDEAKRKKIFVSIEKLEENLGVPVIATSARSGKGLDTLMAEIAKISGNFEFREENNAQKPIGVKYIKPIEEAISIVEAAIAKKLSEKISSRFVSLRLLEGDSSFVKAISEHTSCDIMADSEISSALDGAWEHLLLNGIKKEEIKDKIVACIILTAESICDGVVTCEHCKINERDRKLDKLLTSRLTGIPIMIILLCLIFWLTISGANYPSQLLSTGLFWIQDRLTDFFLWLGTPEWVHGILVLGLYRVLSWVIAVMLPPMAIFFPLFTILEDFGYLPRIAFNLDHQFKKANACGKQALTMCMGKSMLFMLHFR